MSLRDRETTAFRRGRRPAGPWPAWSLALAATTLLAPGVSPVHAQDPTLQRVDSLARWGRTDQARSVLEEWFEDSSSEASSRDVQRSLWLRAILTVDPERAALDLQRLALEHPAGPWTDEAHLRLGQYAEARGDLAEAARHFRSLVRDHPGSPHRLTARGWLDRNARAVRRAELAAVRAGEPSPSPADAAPPDTLGRERVARSVPSARRESGEETPETARPAAETPPEAVEPEADAARGGPEPEAAEEPAVDPGTGDYTVQLGAFSTRSRAVGLIERLRRAGFEPRLATVPGSDLLRVRIGRFTGPAGALELRDRLRADGFEAILRDDAEREEAGGG